MEGLIKTVGTFLNDDTNLYSFDPFILLDLYKLLMLTELTSLSVLPMFVFELILGWDYAINI